MTHTEYMRIWRNNNRERYRQITNKATAKWRKNNPEKVKAKYKRDNDIYRFGGNREKVLRRDRYRCIECKTTEKLSVDHIDGNRSNNKLSNLQTLCFTCHGSKDGKRGWIWDHLGNVYIRRTYG